MSRHPLHLLAVLVFLLLSFPASRSLALTATFNSAADIPVTSSGYTASGSLTLVLNFSPSAGTALTVVKNTAITPISGTFAGLPQGGTISAVFAGHTYNFIAHYWAGTGNDLVLVWPDTGLVAWGANTTAAIGDGSTTNRLTPVAVNTGALLAGKTILATAGGYLHSLALTSEGKVYAWGDNSYGQLGDGTTTQRAAPVQVVNTGALSGKTVVAIAAGAYHSLALTSEGKLYAWGNDFYQQLGDGSGADGSSTTPVVVNMSVSLAGKTVVAIAAGGYHNLALSSDGLLHAWGDSLYGQTGGGLFNVVFISPVSVTSVDPAVSGKLATAISAGAAFSLALLADGTVAAWGRNFDGQLGDGTTTDRSQAVAIVQNGALAGKTVTGISAGGYHSVAVSADGKLYGWGSNATYQVGNGSGSNALVPVETSTHLNPALTGKQIVTAAAGLYHSMALTDDGVLVTWGYAGQGALGNGSTDNRSWPTTVPIFGVLSNRRLLHLPAMSSAQHSMMTCSDAPDVKVEDSGASPVVELADGGASSFGNVLLGQNVLRTFTVQNNGTLPLTGMSVSVDGTHSADFTITQQPATTLAAGASTTFVARFAPGAAGTRTAALHLASNDPDEVSFDIAVSGNGSTSTVLSLTMASAGSIPLSTSGFVAGGLSLSLTLGFAPQTGANLTVIDNGGLAPIGGRFSNVAQGATVTLTFAGVPYNFIATYWGGTGNDLLLLWPATAMAAWGSNANGNLGDNTHTNSSVPVNVIMTGGLAGKTIAAFSRGGCSVGLTTEGKAYSWGNNLEYQLGTAFGPNLWPDVTQPIEVYAGGVLGGKTLVAVSAGYPHSLTLDTDGHVYAWGYRGNGVLGNGGAFTTPGGIAAEVDRTGVLAGKFIVSVSAGTLSSLALASDGQAFAWGLGTGDGTATERWSPVAVDRSGVLATRSVTAIAAGNAGGLAVTSDGRIAAWGSNTYGNLGDGTTTTRLSPVLLSDTGVLSGKVITRVATNGKSSYALASDGSLFAWGYNAAGDLGDGTTTDRLAPVAVDRSGVLAGKTITAISPRFVFTGDGAAYGWGENSTGSVGDGTTVNRLTPVAVNTSGVINAKPVNTLATGGGGVIFTPLPDIAVEDTTGTAVNVITGGTVDFGSVNAGQPATRTFTVRNAGSALLTLTGVTKDGAHAADFTVGPLSATSLAPAAEAAFSVTFIAGSIGARTAAIHLASNDHDENPFNISFTGTGILPEIAVEQPAGTNLNDGGSLAFGNVDATAGTTRTVTIRNTGTASLAGVVISIDGGNSGDFTIAQLPATTMAAGGVITFDLNCRPLGLGARAAALHIASNDADESPFDLVLSCTGTGVLPPSSPEIAVETFAGTSVNLPDGGSTGFGTLTVAQQAARTFTVRNTGTASLTGLAIAIDGTHSGDFSVTQAPASSVAAGGSTSFIVRCQPGAAGARTAVLHLANNDSNESPFEITLECTSVAEEVVAGTFNSAADVPVTAAGFTASGKVLALNLNFMPSSSTGLTVIRNTGPAFISGTFAGLPHGAEISLNFLDRSYPFIADYFGGSGNDLTLVPKYTTIAAAGNNLSGQLGDGTTTNHSTSVTTSGIAGLAGRTVLGVSSGQNHSLALTRDGAVFAWGRNDFGQIGDGTNTDRPVPVAVSTSGVLVGKTVVAIAAGYAHNIVLTSEGKVYSWGANNTGQLGDGTTANRSLPVEVVATGVLAGKTVTAVSAGSNHTIVLTADNLLFAWGENSSGQVGDNSSVRRTAPVAVNTAIGIPSGKTFVSVAAGGIHSMVLTSDGLVYTWGYGGYGQLGDGSATFRLAPVPVITSGVLNGKAIVAIAGGLYHSMALSSDGQLYAWGQNTGGQLGDNTLLQRNDPVAMVISPLAGRPVTHLSAAAASTHVRLADGAVYSCGLNSSGQLAAGDTVDRSVLAAAPPSGALQSRPVLQLGHAQAANHLLMLTALDPSGGFGTLLPQEIVVEVNTTGGPVDLADNTGSISFGTTPVGTPVIKYFTVRNSGPATLTLGAITKDGTHAADFTVGPLSATSLAATATATFTVTFNPLTGGAKTAAIHIGSDDANENPFDIGLSGTGAADPPDIAVEQPAGTNLVDGGNVAFGNVDATAGTTRAFTIRNTGVGSLTVGAITFDGASSGDFAITQAPATTVAPGGSTTFNLRCLPLGLGARSAAMHIVSNDPDESPFDLGLTCTGTGILPLPEIVVEDTTSGTVNLTDGGSVGFGSLETTQNVTRNFTVRNTGTVALAGLAITIDGTHSADFTVTQAPATSVAAGGSTTFSIRCQPGALGARSAALHLANNDPDEAPFDLTLSCTGIAPPPAPEIVVEDSTTAAVDLADGGSVGFGTLALVQQATRTFTVRNTGTANLIGLAITTDGANSGDFAVTQSPAATVAAGGSTTFAVRCQPLAAGARTAALHLANNDANESPFDLTLTCTGVTAEVMTGTFNSAADIPITAASYTSASKVLSLTLNFIPTFSTSLTVIRNTGQAFITGTFNNLPQGAEIGLTYLNISYPFIADYYGGSGNDLVLVPKNTTIAAAGENSYGQLGDASQINRSTSVTTNGVAGIAGRTVLAVASGLRHSLALTRDGRVFAWGQNDVGQLGAGPEYGDLDLQYALTPVPVSTSGVLAGKTVIAIAAGEKHSLALTSEGRVYTWGWNSVGQLGDGTNFDRTAPVEVVSTGALAGRTVVAISGGGNHSLVLTSDNFLFAWGWNSYGQIGDNSAFNRNAPVAVNTAIGIPAGKTFVSLAAGSVHSMVLSSDGKIYSWGRNNNGQLGDASTTNRLAPVPVVNSGVLSTKTIVAIAGGGFHSNALSSDNLLYAWGLNSSGQLGDSTLAQSTSPVTTVASALAGRLVTQLSASAASTHVRLADGAVYSCGLNSFGQLAVGDTNNRTTLTAAVIASGGLLNRPALELGQSSSANHLTMLTAIDPPGGFGTLLTPEIVVEDITGGGNVDLTDNTDNTGSVAFGTGATARNITRTFRVRNTGTGDLTGLGLTVNGAHAGDFTPSSLPGTSVVAGGSLTFTVAFSPLADGTRTAALHLANNDANEAPFDIVLTGTGKTGAYWTWAFDLGIIDDPLAAPGADMEGDGTDNRLEFAFGLSPLQKDTRGMTFNGSTFTTGLPFAMLTGSPPRIRVTFLRRLNAPGLSYTVEFSDENVTWQAASSAPVVASTNGNFEVVTLDDTIPPPSRTRRLVRVRVTAP